MKHHHLAGDIGVRPPRTIDGQARRVAVLVVYVVLFWGILPLFLLTAGRLIDALLNVLLPQSAVVQLAGWTLVISGAAVILSTFHLLWRRGHGLPVSHLPPRAFVGAGPYTLVRHPNYVGFTMLVAGVALLMRSPGTLLYSVPLLVAGWLLYVRLYEEPILQVRFGNAYRDYCVRTGMLPRLAGGAVAAAGRKTLDTVCRAFQPLANHTVLYRKGNLIIVTYGLLIAAGALCGFSFTGGLLLSQGFNPGHIVLLLVAVPLAIPVFARTFWLAGNPPASGQSLLSAVRSTGFVSWGGFAGGVIAVVIIAIVLGLPWLVLLDAATRGGFLGYAIGRLGCVSYGCCYGVPSDHGLRYHSPDAKVVREHGPGQLARIPVQLYLAGIGLIIFLILAGVATLDPEPGAIAALAFLLYAPMRSAVEFFRDRPRVGVIFTKGHLGCLGMFLLAWLLLLFAHTGPVAPPVSTPIATTDLMRIAPGVAAGTVVIFVAYAIQWKQIGRC
jgi:phosphatidylglycerol:prolipoprotein diacylglycerol transferase